MIRLITCFIVVMGICYKVDAQSQIVKCGQIPIFKGGLRSRRAEYRIVGGRNAVRGEFPWQIALFYHDTQICGGSIIAPKWVVTAAHCVRLSSGTYWIRAGKYSLKGSELTEQKVKVLRIEKHVEYNVVTFDNDIAILELEKSLVYTKYVQPVCLPRPDENPKDTLLCDVSGWGLVNKKTPRSSIMQKIRLPVFPFKKCKSIHDKIIPQKDKGSRAMVTENMLCAGNEGGGSDACKGDSGGPMVCLRESSSSMVLYGITSWGIGCGGILPGLYVRVSKYAHWLQNIMDGKVSADNKDPCSGAGVVIKGQLPVTISSNGYDGRSAYGSHLHCTWTIELPGSSESHVGILKFSDFGTEPDETCNYDYVKVYSGENTDDLLGSFCGEEIPTALRSRGSLKFKVIFHSDDSVGSRGFQAKFYRSPKDYYKDSNCGSLGNIKTKRAKLFPESGVITSFMYPDNYISDTECLWTIRASRGHRIQLTFEDAKLEGRNANGDCQDKVTLYDTKRPKIGKEIGSSVCGTYDESFSVTSSGRHMTVKFTADAESESRGFRAVYKSIPIAEVESKRKIPQSTDSLARSNLEGKEDVVNACGVPFYNIAEYDGVSMHSRLVEGNEAVPNSLPWAAHVIFCYTDPYSKDSEEEICKTCDGSLIDSKWVVTVAHCFNEGVVTKSLSVILGDHDKAVAEKTEVKIVAEQYIKHPTFNPKIIVANNIALVEFRDTVRFSKEIKPICIPSPDICFSPDTVCLSVGWGGPATYGSDKKKLRVAKVPLYSGEKCKSAVGEFLFNPSLICGGFENEDSHKDQCGPEAGGGFVCRSSPKQPWILYGIVNCGYGCIGPSSPSLYTKISALSEWITETMGYDISRQPTSKDISCIAQKKRKERRERLSDPCQTTITLTEAKGEIESRNHPEVYDSNLNCTWRIQLPDKTKFVKITFADEFEIEADDLKCLDYITISDLDGKLIGHPLCDKWKPAFPIFSLGGAIVHFESDYSGNFNGFELFYEMTDNKTVTSNCQSGYLLTESGMIHSSDYPENYPSSHHCEWLLEAVENKVIQLEYDLSFAIEETDGCQYDYVEMFNSDIDGRLVSSIGKLCGNLNTEQLKYRSETRWMVVKFITDASKNASGFVASFSSA